MADNSSKSATIAVTTRINNQNSLLTQNLERRAICQSAKMGLMLLSFLKLDKEVIQKTWQDLGDF
jgi:hypothetical protein